jgi:hypothetical protein
MKFLCLPWERLTARCQTALLLTTSVLMGTGTIAAQTAQQRMDAVSAHLKQLQSLSAQLPARSKDQLSTGTQHMLAIADHWNQLAPQLVRNVASLSAPLNNQSHPSSGALPRGSVSDPSTDLLFSRMAGFTQSETSTAWCGNTVVVTYNDSGSFFETFFSPRGLSFSGYSSSSDGGKSFTDRGFLNPGPDFFNFLGGDPVVTCGNASTFFLSNIFSNEFVVGVSVSKSVDGGQTFADPIVAVGKDPFFHIVDKPWMASDPVNPNKLYVTYTDFDFSGTLCPGFRQAIELVRSVDGGATWSAPTTVDNGCSPLFNQGSNVAVDGAGNVFVAWEQFPPIIPTNEIDIRKSTDGGATFGPKAFVATITPVGSPFGLLQGGFRNNEFPSLAIDVSGAPGKGPLYIAWNDGAAGIIADFFGTYNFGDAMVTRSNNGGVSWSSPVRVNDDPAGSRIDHYLPGIAVDRNGTVGVCFYDRRRDPQNFLIDRECASSKNYGQTWKNHRITKSSFSPIIASDLLINAQYMGDYDGVTADVLGQFAGFRGAFGDNSHGNPDVSISPRFGGSKNVEDEDQ